MRGGQILTVSQVNSHLKNLMDEDLDLKSIFVRGEISNFTHHLKSGHFYFTLKDSKAALKAVMFRWNASQLRFMPQNGMSVIAFGGVQFFERDGLCQFYCTDMQPDGLGALYAAFEQLKARLEAEGLFDPAHKKPLPALPRRIGVITAKTGAALQDIIHILSLLLLLHFIIKCKFILIVFKTNSKIFHLQFIIHKNTIKEHRHENTNDKYYPRYY